MANRSLAQCIRLGSFTALIIALSASATKVARSAGSPQIVGGAVGGIGAISQAFPPRDRPPVFGTGLIRGRVVDAATGRAIARARVRLMGPTQLPAMQTDTDGLFAFSKLAPGSYTLQADKATYSRVMWPERRSLRARPLTLGDGEMLEGITLSLHPGSVLAGRILDAFGDPVENASVSIIRMPRAGSVGPIQQGGMRGMQSANDIGEFRIPRVEPGTYVIVASGQRFGPPEEALPYGTTYYPGVGSLDQAQPITIEKGQSISGLEWSLIETTRTTVSGRVVDSKSEPVREGAIMVRLLAQGIPQQPFGSNIQIKSDGTFETKLEPGEYRLEVFGRNGPPASTMIGGRRMTPEPERGQVALSVAGDSVNGVVITTGYGGSASGRVVFEGQGLQAPDVSRTQIMFIGEPNDPASCSNRGPTSVNPDGTFFKEGLWGKCRIGLNRMMGSWQLKAVRVRGEDITTSTLTFEEKQHVSEIEVVFTDQLTELRFEVVDEHNAPLSEYVALTWRTDRELWGDRRYVFPYVPPSPLSQNLSNARPVMTGLTPGAGSQSSSAVGLESGPLNSRSALRAIPPGDYFVAVLEDATQDDLQDMAFLERLSRVATRVTLDEGESKVLQLRRVTLPADAR